MGKKVEKTENCQVIPPYRTVKKYFGKFPPESSDPNQIFSNLKEINSQFRSNLVQKKITVDINRENNHFDIEIDDIKLIEGGIRLCLNNTVYSTFKNDIIANSMKNVNLNPLSINEIVEEDGENAFGTYHDYIMEVSSQDEKINLRGIIRIVPKANVIIFRIEFPEKGFKNHNNINNFKQIIQFPVFKNESNLSRVLTFDKYTNNPEFNKIDTSSPILFYNDNLESMILTPTMNFMTNINIYDEKSTEIRMGLMGQLKEIEKEFFHESLLYFDTGITNTFYNWGDLILKYYQKERYPNDIDGILSSLGYWTSPGTYHYNYFERHNHENYEESLLNIKRTSDSFKIPYNYFQLGDWFYHKDNQNGIIEWEGKTDHFPNGLFSLVEKLNLPLICSAGPFSFKNNYQEEDEGKWITQSYEINKNSKKERFKGWKIPDNENTFVWDTLMEKARVMGCICYEATKLRDQMEFFDYFKENSFNALHFLHNMSTSGINNEITIQFNDATPGLILSTLALPNITHIKTIADPNKDDYNYLQIPKFTISSLLTGSVGIWPWKGPIVVKSNKFNSQERERAYALELITQVLSGGPVGNGDNTNNLEKYTRIINQSCREDGVLLQPDRPLIPIDLMFIPNKKPYTCSTFSEINGAKWYYILQTITSKNKIKDFSLTPTDLGLTREYIVFDYLEKKLKKIDSSKSIHTILAGNVEDDLKNINDFKYYVLAPVLANGMALIGLRDKFTTMPANAFNSVLISGNKLLAKGNYIPLHEFTILLYCPNKPKHVTINNEETDHFTWGPYYKTLTIQVYLDQEEFSLSVE